MELLANYADDGDEAPSPQQPSTLLKMSVNLAPEVRVLEEPGVRAYEDPTRRQLDYNPKYDTIWAPIVGPVDPNMRDPLYQARNMPTGIVEPYAVNDFAFKEQFHTYNSRGYAADPTGVRNYVGDAVKAEQFKGATVYDPKGPNAEKPKRKRQGDPNAPDYLGPWAPYDEMTRPPIKYEGYIEAPKGSEIGEVETAENVPVAEPAKPAKAKGEAAKSGEGKRKREFSPGVQEALAVAAAAAAEPELDSRSILHISDERDYQGRTWMHPPSELKNREHKCWLPKKVVHTWAGHTKGVSAIRFFPTTGHLLLSAGLDNQVLLWDVYGHNRGLIRSYLGHTKAVKDICFTKDGRKFISASYDRRIKLWDTETGQCIRSFTNGRLPYCAKIYPGTENEFLAGCNDKKIIQWDLNSGQIVQEYDQHLGAVNTITYIDDNRRFVSSADDKTLRVWEYGIPVTIKYIAEPHMHSMPVITPYSDGSCLLGQSLDNQILVYNTGDKFKLNKKKSFRGHVNAGYACGLGVSPDGQYVVSGDGVGQVWFWDWKTSRILKTQKQHSAVVTAVEWHPIEPSRMATAGWDGKINYWD